MVVPGSLFKKETPRVVFDNPEKEKTRKVLEKTSWVLSKKVDEIVRPTTH